jgi:hypothetical protein
MTFRSDKLMTELTVMIRPLSGLNAVTEYMGQRLAGRWKRRGRMSGSRSASTVESEDGYPWFTP